jgi:hypothetical protein
MYLYVYMNVLFIRGYATDMNSNYLSKDAYSSFDVFFMMSSYKLEYFNYSPEEDLSSVYARLCDKLENNLFDAIIGHSMGGGLLLKFLTEHKNYMDCISKTDKKIIFLMPLIERSIANDIIAGIPFIGNVYLPKLIAFPNNFLYNDGNILNDDIYPVLGKQFVTMQHKYIDKLDLSIIDQNNCHMIYAKNELFNIISPQTLNKIKNKTVLEGKHQMFMEANHSTKFFQTLKSLLEK